MNKDDKRLIDANALSEEVDKSKHNNPHPPGMVRANHRNEHDHFLRMIYDAPTVGAVEVVHGRRNTEKCDHVPWRIKNPEKWVIHKCSVCGYSNGRKHSNYCPDCGAKMDGGNEDA